MSLRQLFKEISRVMLDFQGEFMTPWPKTKSDYGDLARYI